MSDSVSIDSISMKITADAKSALDTIKALKEELLGVSDAMSKASNTNLSGVKSIQNLKVSKTAKSEIEQIKNATIAASGGFTTLTGDVKRFFEVKSQTDSIEEKLGSLSAGMDKIKESSELSESSKGTILSQMEKEAEPLEAEMNKLTSEYIQLKNNMSDTKPVGAIQKIKDAIKNLGAQTDSVTPKVKGFWDSWQSKAAVGIAVAKRVGGAIRGFVADSNAYVENLNLFQVAMGDYFDEAFAYANKVQSIMGIDASQWIRNQGIFMTLATGFGVSSDKASIMSKNMTQLGYDLSSFFNLPFEQALTKLQSGLAGELEPLRRLGYDLSVARLQQEAYALGIDKSVSSMTQAEKVQLRYYAIMTQVTTAQGDLARTLENPSNQMRIFAANTQILSRTLGNVFIPILMKIMPYAIAAAKALRLVAEAIANLMGFKLPEIDYSDVNTGGMTDGLAEVGDAADGAKEKMKELKDYTMGFDELNIISPDLPTPSTGSGGSGGGGGALENIPIPEYDFLGKLTEQTDKLVDKMKDILGWVAAIGAGLLAFKISNAFLETLTKMFPDALKGFNALKAAIGVGFLVVSVVLGFQAGADMARNGLTKENIMKAATSVLTGALGGFLVGGLPGLVVGFGISLFAQAFGFQIEKSLITKEKAEANFKEHYAFLFPLIINGLKVETAGTLVEWDKIFETDGSTSALLASLENTREAVRARLSEMQETFIKDAKAAYKALTPEEKFGMNETQFITNYVKSNMQAAKKEMVDGGIGIAATISDAADKDIGPAAKAAFSGIPADASSSWAETGTKFKEAFKNIKDTFATDNSGDYWSSQWANLKTGMSENWEGVRESFSGGIKGAKEKLSDLPEWANERAGKIKAGFSNIKDWFGEKFGDAWKAIKEKFSSVGSFFGGIWDTIRSKFTDIGQKIGDAVGGAFKGAINAVLSTIETIVNGFFKLINGAIKLINKIPGVDIPKINLISIPRLASGGFVDTGQVFLARESGPEMVGQMGNRTAVANNSQIVQGISQGVAQANQEEVALLREQNSLLQALLAKNNNVNIDGRTLNNQLDKVRELQGVPIVSY